MNINKIFHLKLHGIVHEMNNFAAESGALQLTPKYLSHVLSSIGLTVATSKSRQLVEVTGTAKFWLHIKLLLAHVYLVFSLVWGGCLDVHWTFFLASNVDVLISVVGTDILYFRRKRYRKIVNHLLIHFPHDLDFAGVEHQFRPIARILVCTSIFSVIYSVYVACIILNQHGFTMSSTPPQEAAFACINICRWCFYSYYTYISQPNQICVFVLMWLVIENRLACINHGVLSLSLSSRDVRTGHLRKLRSVFCNLQKTTSDADGLFMEFGLVWLTNILIRCCLGSYNIVNMSWTGPESFDQGMVLLNIIFDCYHLLVLCLYAGRIGDKKGVVMESLGYLGSEWVVMGAELRQEFHLFVSLLGHSKMCMTVANIFPLNNNVIVTLLGVVGSYSVVIYQISN